MARQFLDDLRTRIVNELPDNSVGLITPEIMRDLTRDIIDSTVQDEGAINGPGQTGVALTGTYQNLGGYSSSQGGDGTFVKLDVGLGQIVTATTAGFTYEVLAAVSFEGSTNDEYEFAIGINGAPGAYQPSVTGRGPGRPSSVYLRAYQTSLPSDSVITVMARSPDNATIDVTDIILGAIILPTNNP